MKKVFHTPLIVILILVLVSCNKEYPDITGQNDFNGVFVRNEGGTISYYNEDDNTVTADIYTDINGATLGANVGAFSIIGDNGYILKGTGSSQEIELVNSESLKSKLSVDGFSNLTDIKAVSDQFVYATQGNSEDENSGSVLVLDSISLSTIATIKVGKNPTRVAYSRGKRIYVANSGGVVSDSTVMIIDAASKAVTDTIALEQIVDETTTNKLKTPVELIIDAYQNVWVLCVGVDNVGAGLAKINYGTNEVTVFPFTGGYIGNGRNCLTRSSGGGTIYYMNNGVYAMGINDEKLSEEEFFKDTYKDMIFDAIAVNPYTGEFFCSKDGDNGANGSVYIFDQYGNITDNSQITVGVKPRQFTFVR